MNKYIKTFSPVKIKLAIKIQSLFASNKIDALPMKLYSDDDDVDIVIINHNKYKQAVSILVAYGWYCKNNRSKIRERDKDFFHHQSVPFVIHLHKAFSWNTVPYLDSKILWERKRKILGLFYPSAEDELLIIGAHSFFENQYIKPEELLYGREVLLEEYDIQYMQNHAKSFNWENGLNITMKKLKSNTPSLSILELISVKMNKLKQDFGSISLKQSITEVLNYFCIDWIWNYRLLLQKKFIKRPIIITFSGVDGSGKTTQAAFLYQEFKSAGKRVKIIHTGTTPIVNQNPGEEQLNWNPAGYGIFIKDILQIFFSLVNNTHFDVLIFDRYIYDTLVKIAYKQQKKTINKQLLSLAFKLLPKSNLSFLLETSPEVSYKRDANHSGQYHKAKYALYQNLLHHKQPMILIETSKIKKEVDSLLKTKIEPIL